MSVLKKTSLLGSFPSSDRVLVCELLLRGPFHQTPEWLYFRRDHDGRAYRSATRRELSATQNPVQSSRFRYPALRVVGDYLLGYARAVRQAPISAQERRECYGSLGRWMADRAVTQAAPGLLRRSIADVEATTDSRAVALRMAIAGPEHG